MIRARPGRRLVVCSFAAALVLTSCGSPIPVRPAIASHHPVPVSSAAESADPAGSASVVPMQLPTPAQAPPKLPAPAQMVWDDEFSGPVNAPPDTAFWTPQLGGSGWGNQELECYTASRSNSALDGHGDLVIT